jgi:hypothetical protein
MFTLYPELSTIPECPEEETGHRGLKSRLLGTKSASADLRLGCHDCHRRIRRRIRAHDPRNVTACDPSPRRRASGFIGAVLNRRLQRTGSPTRDGGFCVSVRVFRPRTRPCFGHNRGSERRLSTPPKGRFIPSPGRPSRPIPYPFPTREGAVTEAVALFR